MVLLQRGAPIATVDKIPPILRDVDANHGVLNLSILRCFFHFKIRMAYSSWICLRELETVKHIIHKKGI